MSLAAFLRRAGDALIEADTRGLARFRVVHGLALTAYVVHTPLFGRLDAFFTDDGAVSLAALRSSAPLHASATLFALAHTRAQAIAAFVVCALVCLAYAAGLFTRVTTFAAYVVIASIHHRVPFVTNGGMVFMTCLFLPLLLLPLGRHLSVDAWLAARRGSPAAPTRIRSIAMLVVHLQIFVIYFFNVIHKHGDHWMDGTAVHYVLANAQWAWPIGVELGRRAPSWMITAMTYGTLVVEMAIALAVISPFRTRACRIAAAIAIPLLHFGFGALLNVGPFLVALGPVGLLLIAGQDVGLSTADAVAEPPIRRARGLRLGRELVALGLLVFFLVQNRRDEGALRYLFGDPGYSKAFTDLTTVLYVSQRWSMFSSNPPAEQHLLMPVVELEDGRVVDVRTRREPEFERVDGRALEVDFYWQKFDERLVESLDRNLLDSACRYFARRPAAEGWPGDHRVREIALHDLWAKLPRPGEPATRELHSMVVYTKRMSPREEPGRIHR